MAATKVGTILATAQSVAASGTYTTATVDVSTGYGVIYTAQVVVTTALTAGCGISIQASMNTGTTWVPIVQGMTGTAVGTYPFSYTLDAPVMQTQAVFYGNVGAAVTVSCQTQVLTGI